LVTPNIHWAITRDIGNGLSCRISKPDLVGIQGFQGSCITQCSSQLRPEGLKCRVADQVDLNTPEEV
jgi:hypothetical protein